MSEDMAVYGGGKFCGNCGIRVDGLCTLTRAEQEHCMVTPGRPHWRKLVTDREKLQEFLEAGKVVAQCTEMPDKIKKNDHPVPDLNPEMAYSALNHVLTDAYDQAAEGKGKERHATDNKYEDQIICVVGRLLRGHPYGSHAYQVIKKTIEAGRLYKIKGPEAAYNEMLGAINYAAAMNILIAEDGE